MKIRKSILSSFIMLMLLSCSRSESGLSETTEELIVYKMIYSNLEKCEFSDVEYIYEYGDTVNINIKYFDRIIDVYNGKSANVIFDGRIIDKLKVSSAMDYSIVLDSALILDDSSVHIITFTDQEKRQSGSETELELVFYERDSKAVDRFCK